MNHYITYKGETKNLGEWSRITGLNKATIRSRLYDSGWSVEKTLTTLPTHYEPSLFKQFKKEHWIWTQMNSRCYNKNNPEYPRYGGRGITVCDRWSTFKNFIEDMGPKPFPKACIERVNNNEGYSPNNCVWTTVKKNSRNKRNNRMVEFNGETLCVAEWAEKYKINCYVVYGRLNNGWSIGKALTTPVRI